MSSGRVANGQTKHAKPGPMPNNNGHTRTAPEVRWRKLGIKALALGFFCRQVADKAKRRVVLQGFMERMKNQRRADTPELADMRRQFERAEDSNYTVIQTIRPKSPKDARVRKTPEGPTWKKSEVKPGSKCALCCRVFPAFHEHEAIPCRVCDDVFHRGCLEDCGDLQASDKYNIDIAKTNIGWSCPTCANISLLLTTEEIREMTEKFDRLDFNKDAQVSLEEYFRHHARRQSCVDGRGTLLAQERERLSREHERLDQNGDGFMDWWEFVNQESKLYLMKKDKHDLADLLTQKELMAAKAVFRMLDKDGDNKIKSYEAKEAYVKWYRYFDNNRQQMGPDNIITDSDSLEMHATIAAQCIMDADITGAGEVQWKDFILDQALYIICCRPNYRTRRLPKR